MTKPPVGALLDFRDQVVLVTGSGAGLGRAIALRFAEAGADVAVHYSKAVAGAEAVAQEIGTLGRRAATLQADLAIASEVDRLFAEVVAKLGRIDVLVNNAGIYPTRAFLDLPVAEWDEMLNVNLRSAFLCSQAAARLLIGQGSAGAIVNVTSISAHNAAADHAHYSASKAGLEMLTQSTAAELGPHGIRVNAVAPGLIWSETVETDWPEGVARWLARVPLGRLGRPEDVADACLFLASPAARWITGASIRVDGGVMTRQIY